MPKEIPTFPANFHALGPAQESRTYHIPLITPLFGGGVEPRVNSERFPIRETSIRGHLRFWWRATCGRRFTDLSALWRREEEVFGSTEFPSPLQVKVEDFSPKPPVFLDAFAFNRSGPGGYAVSALQSGDRVIREELLFRLKMTWKSVQQLARQRKAQNQLRVKANENELPADVSDIADELREAIWAWVNFGGLGGRTRRGCGSLLGKEVDDKGNVVRELV